MSKVFRERRYDPKNHAETLMAIRDAIFQCLRKYTRDLGEPFSEPPIAAEVSFYSFVTEEGHMPVLRIKTTRKDSGRQTVPPPELIASIAEAIIEVTHILYHLERIETNDFGEASAPTRWMIWDWQQRRSTRIESDLDQYFIPTPVPSESDKIGARRRFGRSWDDLSPEAQASIKRANYTDS